MTERAHWWAVHTGAGLEQYATGHLRRQGVRVFIPLEQIKTWRRINGHKKGRQIVITRPLLSRYVFGRFTATRIDLVNETPGVSTVVHFGLRGDRYYLPVPDHTMNRLIDRADEEGIIGRDDWTKLSRLFSGKVGERVNFSQDSPLYGVEAFITSLERLDKAGEIEAEMKWFGVVRRVPVPLRDIVVNA